MKNLQSKELIKLGKKHKKWRELVTMNNFPYLIENNRYFLAYYYGRFSTDVTSCAVVSPDSGREQDAVKALKPLIYFSISINNIGDVVTARAKLEYNVWVEIKEYLHRIIVDNVLDSTMVMHYKRSLEITNNMIELQEEMIQMKVKVDNFVEKIIQRGYFIDTDIEEALQIIPTLDWLQYAQFKDRYKYKEDFDLIYENQNNPEIKRYMEVFTDNKTLYNMTSEIAAKQIKETLDLLSENKDLSHMTREEYHDFIFRRYLNRLEKKVPEMKAMLRYPRLSRAE